MGEPNVRRLRDELDADVFVEWVAFYELDHEEPKPKVTTDHAEIARWFSQHG